MEMIRPTRTSYSAISTWEGCGAAYKFSYIEGVERAAGPSAQRGTRLHKSGELFVKGKLPDDQLPVDYWRVRAEMNRYREVGAKAEAVWCVTPTWAKCLPANPNIYIKAIVDLHYQEGKVLDVTDLKTGRIYDDHVDQLQLYATIGFSYYPKVEAVKVGGLYIDEGRRANEATYPRSMMKPLREHWTERANAVLNDTKFLPKPSESNCKWCSHSYKKGGPCKDAA